MTPPLLALEAVTKRYRRGDDPAVRDLSLAIAPGEFLGLLGPNGAGKSTTIGLLCGVLAPDHGTVRVGGDGRPLPSLVGWVPQDIALYPSLTCRENLLFFGRMHGLGGAVLQTRVTESLTRVGLQDASDRPVSTCSGGMKRRANLAAALVHAPALLILDEPTVGVDPQSRALVQDLLRTLHGQGTALLLATHLMEEAQALCSRVCVLDQGRVVADGSPASLVSDHPPCRDLGEVFLALTGRTLRDDA